MPSIKKQYQGLKKVSSTLILSLLCSSILVACGGGETTRVSPPVEDNETPPDTSPKMTLNVIMPVHVINANMQVQLATNSTPVYKNEKFTGFDVQLKDLDYRANSNKLYLVTLTGDNSSSMYDPILNKYVPFNGTMHALGMLSTTTQTIYITPATEAIYQRAVVRSNQFDVATKDIDLSLITNKHFSKSTTEVRNSLHSAFFTNTYPRFSNPQSISVIKHKTSNDSSYNNLFSGLGLLQYWFTKYPKTINTYLDLAHNIGVDLRDGYLDGRTIQGDKTAFKTIPAAPINYNPQNNTLLKIGALQQLTRETFGNEWKVATLHYATQVAFQTSYNPLGIKDLESLEYYTKSFDRDYDNLYRWLGAGDYRPAFGLTNTESCSNGLNPCKQGLNADDLETNINHVEYLIGTHQLNQCTIKFYPSGDVSISKGDKIYRSSVNRDLSDNMQQLNHDPQHYILNVGASENKPAYFLQFEVKDLKIINARTGYNYDIYPTALETKEMDCAN